MLGSDKYQTKTFTADSGDTYGIQGSMTKGLKQIQSELKAPHPLAESEIDYDVRMKQMNMSSLRNSQGIHAPLRLQMEINAVDKALTRLPCLPSSNFAKDILNGTDDVILPEEIFGDIEDNEKMGQPHLMMEHKLGLKPL